MIFVKWLDEANRYTRLDARNFEFLGSNAGPLDVLAVMNFLPSDGTDLDQILSGADPSFAAKSISAAEVKRPIPMRKVRRAAASPRPSARST